VVLVERKSIVVNKLAIFVTKLTFLVFEYPSVSNLMTFAKQNYLVYIEKVRCENYLPLDSSFYTPEILAELTKFYPLLSMGVDSALAAFVYATDVLPFPVRAGAKQLSALEVLLALLLISAVCYI
jgi:hypothetical protein